MDGRQTMRSLLLTVILALTLKPTASFAQQQLPRENILLAYCERVALDNFDYIFVEASRSYPGLALVKIMYTDKIVKGIHVSLNEWQEKSITLPSEGGATYRLFLNRRGWNVLKSFTDTETVHAVNCRTSST